MRSAQEHRRLCRPDPQPDPVARVLFRVPLYSGTPLGPGTGAHVSDLVYDWLGEDSGSPWGAAASRVQAAMESRGLLRREVTTRRVLKLITLTR